MRRLFSVLCVCLLLPHAALAATVFAPADAQAAKLAALECLQVCAFQAEYHDGQNGRLTLWQDPVNIWLYGQPTRADREVLADFLMTLAVRVPLLPNIRLVEEEEDANLTIYYGPLASLEERISGYVPGNWGIFTYWYNNDVRNSAQIGIAMDVTTQAERNHLIKEELVGALGLSNDHKLYEDSILYGIWTVTQTLSDVDWLMLNMAYSPYIRPGMTYDEVYDVLYPMIVQ